MVLSLLTTCLLSTTFAKYVTAGSSSASARVAKWGVTVETDLTGLFLDRYNVNDRNEVISFNGDDIVAPGTSNSFNMNTSVKGVPEVAVEVQTSADVTITNWDVNGYYYCPLTFTVNGATISGNDFLTPEEFETWIEGRISKLTAQYAPLKDLAAAEEIDLSISWSWPFEVDDDSNAENGIANDTLDTALGNKAADGDTSNDPKIEFSITQTVFQINSFREDVTTDDRTPHNCHDTDKNHYCDECDTELSIHRYEAGSCTTCSHKLYIREYNTIKFGTYPQTDVTASSVAATLNAKAGRPGASDLAWTSYGYYASGAKSDYMWYIDIEEGGEKYRGVYMSAYRPTTTLTAAKAGESNQDTYGYHTGNVYWFKYEPISWQILSENTSTGDALIWCNSIIDSQQFYVNEDKRGSIYPNNYEHSTIRAWLNDNFYNCAFSELQKELILTTLVDNSKSSGNEDADYVCANTNDKVFLLSLKEVSQYTGGYPHNNYNGYADAYRRKAPTSYARAQGIEMGLSEDSNYSPWWLRSAGDAWSDWCLCANADGVIYEGTDLIRTEVGVLPALNINLNKSVTN